MQERAVMLGDIEPNTREVKESRRFNRPEVHS